MLEKTYSPKILQEKIYSLWEKASAFKSDTSSAKKPYTIMMPPANVTGTLHVGHALTYTLQDILIRYHRMKGEDVLWQPGTDHAGIATQMVVERKLTETKENRRELGREAFVERIWKWKEESGNNISQQLRLLGASADWSRERFTMDEGLSTAVRKAFIELYHQGLIYKDKRLVNWDVKFETAVSDLEVEQHLVKGQFYYIRYPLVGDSSQYITVATSRPETLFGDVAIAVHPEDKRYASWIGKKVHLPLTNKTIPIIADTYSDPEKGTGAVKITPGHDFNDFNVGKRHNLPLLNIFTLKGYLNEQVPIPYQGLERFEARKKIIEDLENAHFLEKIEEVEQTLPYGERSGVIIEPLLTDQWYVDAQKLAIPAIKAVEDKKTIFVPSQWKNTYYEWLNHIEPWCISRQIWWGHRIPAWYGPDGKIFVAENTEEAYHQAHLYYGKENFSLTQDEDVLDTWFSSAIWPFSTLGWPIKTLELDRYYPTSVLITGFDIIFFWVARMMMMGLHFMKEVPFHTVYLHALVRDEKGQKMSKSKGNVLDPVYLIEKYGTDALRFTLCAFAAQGRDIKLSEARIEGYRNFTTKIWNAARFLEIQGCVFSPSFNPEKVTLPLSKWLIGEITDIAQKTSLALDTYKFNEAAHTLYQGIWHTFCDWGLEFSKCFLNISHDQEQIQEVKETLGWCFCTLLHLLHPFMPFISEELWAHFQKNLPLSPSLLITNKWPDLSQELLNPALQKDMSWIQNLITLLRAFRADLNIPPKENITLYSETSNEAAEALINQYAPFICALARIKSIQKGNTPIGIKSLDLIYEENTFYIPIEGLIDIEIEKNRISKELASINKEIHTLETRLSNTDFIARAPLEIVEEQKMRKEKLVSLYNNYKDAFEKLEKY